VGAVPGACRADSDMHPARRYYVARGMQARTGAGSGHAHAERHEAQGHNGQQIR
jgi:hypothetical protein